MIFTFMIPKVEAGQERCDTAYQPASGSADGSCDVGVSHGHAGVFVDEEIGVMQSCAPDRDIPFRFAIHSMDGIRQWGIVPAFFQLETVDGGALMALATSTVPPRAVIICSAVIMQHELR